ncbi:MAG: response regulator [Treponema sp.]|uniref:response regulator n=1 Tax=Treponema sp. TaxID=166 RepID=UPI001B405500|nr:response regulator [Treponema sp.]MBP5403221.1 response regulator [Treponema sp.]MBR5932757.1 response regulator [Treponema sp.]
MAGARKKIIIIDDVELNRTILGEAFSKKYDVIEASDGEEGLEKIMANRESIAAIFLDIIMPEMDGFSVLAELERNEIMRTIPLFIITTETTDYVVERAYNYGVIDVIQKPFNLLIIERRVANIIELFENRTRLEKLFTQKNNAEEKNEAEIALKKYKAAMSEIAGIIEKVEK